MSRAEFDWWPKPFGPGDTAGEGARKILGKPNLNPIAVLVRETAQNSWDARIAEKVSFEIHGRTLTGDARQALTETIFAQPGQGTNLNEILRKDSIPVLEISDRGTSGLGGPIRNDRVHGSDVTDYIDLVLNVGAKRDAVRGGGTHGFGKTISYIASSAHTVLILSRSKESEGLETRLIGSAFGDEFDCDGLKYTGRQWWGHKTDDEMIEPVTGSDAEALAAQVFSRGFEDGETGTSLLIIAPTLDERSLEGLLGACGDSILWHLWPKLVPHPANSQIQSMLFSLQYEGEELKIQDPRKHPLLKHFVASLQAVRTTQKEGKAPQLPFTKVCDIKIKRPKATTGHLGITQGASEFIAELPTDELDLAPVSSPVHSVALMRHDAELVVTYLKMDRPATDGLEVAGVFRCESAVDDYFAASEPPTHDKWEPKGMEDKTAQRHVNVSLKRIHEEWNAQVGPSRSSPYSPSGAGSEGFLSAALADLVPAIGGVQAGSYLPTASSSSKAGKTAKPIVRFAGGAARSTRGEMVIFAQPFMVESPADGYRIRCNAGIGFDGGTDSDHTDPAAIFSVEGFINGHFDRDAFTTPDIEEPVLELTAESSTKWMVVISHEPGYAIDIDLRVEEN